MSLLELFVDVDDFCQIFLPKWQKRLLSDGSQKRLRKGKFPSIPLSELQALLHRACLPAIAS
jgi:hypothetical protein